MAIVTCLTVPGQLRNSPKARELVTMFVLVVTEDGLSSVTDVRMETIWFVIALGPMGSPQPPVTLVTR